MCLDTVAEFLKKNSLKIIAYKLLKMWFIQISEWLLLFFEWVYAKKKIENILHVSLNVTVALVKLIPFAFPFYKNFMNTCIIVSCNLDGFRHISIFKFQFDID